MSDFFYKKRRFCSKQFLNIFVNTDKTLEILGRAYSNPENKLKSLQNGYAFLPKNSYKAVALDKESLGDEPEIIAEGYFPALNNYIDETSNQSYLLLHSNSGYGITNLIANEPNKLKIRTPISEDASSYDVKSLNLLKVNYNDIHKWNGGFSFRLFDITLFLHETHSLPPNAFEEIIKDMEDNPSEYRKPFMPPLINGSKPDEVANVNKKEQEIILINSDSLHENTSEKLKILLEANSKFWTDYDESDTNSIPKKDDVTDWLIRKGFSQTLAENAATILSDGRKRPN